MKMIKKGSQGPDVGRWQQFLRTQGSNIAVDDDFGARTVSATQAFQEKYGLQVDGVVGEDTYKEAAKHGIVPENGQTNGTVGKELIRVLSKDGTHLYKLSDADIVFFTANMAVDADGCPLAYHPGDTGLDAIANSGWLKPNIVAFDPATAHPYIQTTVDPAPGYYTSMTSWKDAALVRTNPRRYVDALKLSYIVIPGGDVGPARMGNAALVINLDNGRQVSAVVGDGGSDKEAGEASMFCAGLIAGLVETQITEALARQHGSVINPRNGGPNGNHFRYIVFANVHVPWGSSNQEVDRIARGAWSALSDHQRSFLSA